jgi:AcrR family transcriptional regulator
VAAADTPRTQAQRRDRSESSLLDAAAELICERGVEGTSLAAIGERAGVSRGLPTHYFGSKDTLVARLAKRAQDGITSASLEILEHAERRIDEISSLDLLHLTIDAYLGLLDRPDADQRALIVMWGSTFPSVSSVEGMLEADRRSYDEWAALIAHGQDEGSIRGDVDPKATAIVLTGLIRGVAAMLLTDADTSDADEVRRTCHQWIAATLSPQLN